MPDQLPNGHLIRLNGVRYLLSFEDEYVDVESYAINGSHIHNYIEIYLHVEGDVSFLVKNEMYRISRGDMVITRANEFHHCVYHSSCTHKHFCLWIADEEGDDLLGFIRRSKSHHLRFSTAEQDELYSLFLKLYDMGRQEDSLETSACLLRIFVILRRRISQTVDDHTGPLTEKFQRILDFINVNYAGLTNICELSETFFVSTATLNRWFVKYLRVSPKSYLESVKLSNAKRMLDEGKSVTEACFDCGYSDCSHFIRVFKKKFGITPHKYKAK